MFSQGLHLSARLWLAKGSSADLSGQEHYSLFPQKRTPVKAAVTSAGAHEVTSANLAIPFVR